MNKTRFLALLVLLAACTSSNQLPVVRIATDATFAPFHYLDDSGKPTGFDVEFARAVAFRAGFRPEIIVLPYDELFSGLLNGSHDLVAATTGITRERQETYLFSEPYFETCQIAVVRTGASEPAVVGDLVGLRIGASGQGTSARAMNSIEGIHVSTVEGQNVQMLLDQSLDAWIVDEFNAVSAARASKGRLRVLSEGITTEKYGFVFAGENHSLQKMFNAGLAELTAMGTDRVLLEMHGVQRGSGWPVSCTE